MAGIICDGYDVGTLATGAHGFYARLGWERWRGPTFAPTGDRRRRTEDDGALMVLRFGASRDLPLTAPITCQARPATTGERQPAATGSGRTGAGPV